MIARKFNVLGVVAAIVSAGLLSATGVSAQALNSPAEKELASKQFSVVAPFTPGGPVDVLARVVAQGLGKKYGQTSNVDNKPGAAGKIGIDIVKRAPADGHTLLVIPAGNLTINPTLLPQGFTVDGDFAPVTMLAQASNVVVVNPAVVNVNTIAELVALSKAKPGTVAYATPGVGSGLHLAGELFKQQSGADMLHVPYKGSGPAITDLLGGTVGVMFGNLPTLQAHIASGKLRALAVTGATRAANIPNVPTLKEAGVPGVEVTSWYGMLAPKGTPPAVVAQLASDAEELLTKPETKAELDGQGMSVWIVKQDAFGDLIRKETATWAPIIKSKNITPE
ncbi:tripartite tricarboxylate transporter substrate binding protein [soil metagenome]